MTSFSQNQPIFLQIRQRIIEMILREEVPEGGALPSVRQVATDLQVNPLTVTKAYDGLVDAGAVEMRRGVGMFVATGARENLLAGERRKFLEEEWPAIRDRIAALGLDATELLGKGAGK